MLVDLHAHFPMHVVPARGAHECLTHWRSHRVRSAVVRAISGVANYQGPQGSPSVTVDPMRQGDVGVALSVLYSPFDEMDLGRRYGDPPESGYFGRLLDQLEAVERHVRANEPHARIARGPGERLGDAPFAPLFAQIDHIAALTGSFDHIAIGSDLDGFIKPALPGLEHMGRMRDLQHALRERYGPSDANRICAANALRVLRWCGAPASTAPAALVAEGDPL